MTSATRNYHRMAAVWLHGTKIAECKKPPDDGHRISFSVRRTHRATPSTASIQIYGLAAEKRTQISEVFEAARAKLFAEGDTVQGCIKDVRLDIGYDGKVSTLLVSDIVDIVHEEISPAGYVTTITAQDGGAPWRGSTINEMLMPGVPIDMVITVLTKAFDVAVLDADARKVLSEAMTGFSTKAVAGGYVLQGPTSQVMTDLFESMGLELSYQNGKLQLLKFMETKADVAVVLQPQTGLLRRPRWKRFGRVTLHCQAHPLLEPGRQVQLLDEAGAPQGAGIFRVDTAESTGDTHGGSWETVVEASPRNIRPS